MGLPRLRYTPENISFLNQNEIFVFGSNGGGQHIGGAAYTALAWGAKMGVAEGLCGKTYAIPTLTEDFNKVTKEDLKNSFARFFSFALINPGRVFLVTKIGCGIAAWDICDVAILFWEAARETYQGLSFPCVGNLPENIVVPQEFYEYLPEAAREVWRDMLALLEEMRVVRARFQERKKSMTIEEHEQFFNIMRELESEYNLLQEDIRTSGLV